MTNKLYLLALNRIASIGPKAVAKFLENWPELKSMFALTQTQLEQAGLTPKMAAAVASFDLKTVDADLLWEKQSNHYLLTIEDKSYPALLKEIYDPPTVLYAAGDLNCLTLPKVAMVGTRKPSLVGQETAKLFAGELCRANITVVSGLAEGIDAYAHRGCLEVKGKTIAVMGTGINRFYPYKNHTLAQEILENGLIITEFPLNCPPRPGHFPRRNRIISGLSLATLVVEAAVKSGSLITARLAMEQNRDVFAVPGSIHNPQARGCHYLLQQGAKLVTSVKDITEELNLVSPQPISNTTQMVLAKDNKNLVKCVGFDVTTIDELIERSGLSFEKVACGLAELELNGVIQAVPGGYSRCLLELEVIE